jgi:hypothetical protein
MHRSGTPSRGRHVAGPGICVREADRFAAAGRPWTDAHSPFATGHSFPLGDTWSDPIRIRPSSSRSAQAAPAAPKEFSTATTIEQARSSTVNSFSPCQAIGGLVTTPAGSPVARTALLSSLTALAILLVLLALRRSGERAGRFLHGRSCWCRLASPPAVVWHRLRPVGALPRYRFGLGPRGLSAVGRWRGRPGSRTEADFSRRINRPNPSRRIWRMVAAIGMRASCCPSLARWTRPPAGR